MRPLRMSLVLMLVAACAERPPYDDGFRAFWSEFQSAVAADDASAVGRLTRFPFLFESEQSDSTTFSVVYAALFDAPVRDCLTSTTPTEEDGHYLAFCGPIIFVFEQEQGGWRFTEFAADPEVMGDEDEEQEQGDGTFAELGSWHFVDSRSAPWAVGNPDPLTNARFAGTRVAIGAGQVLADAPLGCIHAEYELVVMPAEGLFQGNLPEPAAATARAAGIGRLPALTLRVRCESGVFDYHHARSDTLLIALDNVVWKLAPEPRAATPAGVVRTLLAEHMTASMAFTSQAIASKRAFLTRSLDDQIAHYFAQPQPDDEPPPINGDPFTNSQEYPDRFTIGAIETEGQNARVRVVFTDGFRPKPVDFLLVRSGERWLVDDLRYEDGTTFRETLQQ